VRVDARARNISLREISAANRGDVERLTVTPAQSRYVASVADSLDEAAVNPQARPWFRAVYSGETPVGFVMISDGIPDGHPELLGPYFLWRLLIATRWQGRGYGRAALDLVVDHVRTRADARVLLTSIQPGSTASPRGFYLTYGFTTTGETFDGEEVLALQLPR
jgi:diamine N-acetyltransferase